MTNLDMTARKAVRQLSKRISITTAGNLLRSIGLVLRHNENLQGVLTTEQAKSLTNKVRNLRLTICEQQTLQYTPFGWNRVFQARDHADTTNAVHVVYQEFFKALSSLEILRTNRNARYPRFDPALVEPSFLSAASELKSLTIRMDSGGIEPGIENYLGHTVWPQMEDLVLTKAEIKASDLLTFLDSHSTSLKRLALVEVALLQCPQFQDWATFISKLRERSNLQHLVLLKMGIQDEDNVAADFAHTCGPSWWYPMQYWRGSIQRASPKNSMKDTADDFAAQMAFGRKWREAEKAAPSLWWLYRLSEQRSTTRWGGLQILLG